MQCIKRWISKHVCSASYRMSRMGHVPFVSCRGRNLLGLKSVICIVSLCAMSIDSSVPMC